MILFNVCLSYWKVQWRHVAEGSTNQGTPSIFGKSHYDCDYALYNGDIEIALATTHEARLPVEDNKTTRETYNSCTTTTGPISPNNRCYFLTSSPLLDSSLIETHPQPQQMISPGRYRNQEDKVLDDELRVPFTLISNVVVNHYGSSHKLQQYNDRHILPNQRPKSNIYTNFLSKTSRILYHVSGAFAICCPFPLNPGL